jgi:uncharacterized protein
MLLPVLSRLHKEYNVSAAEIDLQDKWQEAIIACTVVSNDIAHNQRVFTNLLKFLESRFPDVNICDTKTETIHI